MYFVLKILHNDRVEHWLRLDIFSECTEMKVLPPS
jgi:hypothetical protein